MPCAASEKVIADLLSHVEKDEEHSSSLPTHSCKKGEYVQDGQRDSSISNLLKLNSHFGFEPETFCLAVKYVDTFLGKVKVSPKYLEVISLAALVLAAKLSEEDEFIPDVEDFVNVSRSMCSVADVVRMERIMLEKMDWNMFLPTPLTFLEKYCNILEAYGLFSEEEKRSIAQHCIPTLVGVLSTSAFLDHKSSTVALTILNFELSFFNREISEVFCQLSNYSNLHNSELMHCNLLLQEFLDSQLLAICKDKRRKKKRTHSTSSISNAKKTMPTIWEAGDEVVMREEVDYQDDEEEICSSPISEESDPISDSSEASSADDDDIEDIACDTPPAITAGPVFRFDAPSSRPLYSQIVKKTCAREVYESQCIVQPVAVTGRAC